MSEIDVLIVGGGGREHALAWKLRQSPRCRTLLAAPGNAGIARLAECVPVSVGDIEGLVRLAVERKVGLVVVGPEAPLADGLADRLREHGIPTFGPSAAAAQIESSKAFARDLMARAGVPQPEFASFADHAALSAYLDGLEARGITRVVVKASGLAAGKGAIVCDTMAEARAAAREMLVDGVFGSAGAEVVIEERLEGEEVSLLVLTDGEHALPLLPAQDYKRAYDGDLGPNTGGMGCYSPAPIMTPALLEEAMGTVVLPTLRGLSEAGAPFQGCLYAGLMQTAAGLKVIEFNCRFGDPETQVVLPLLDSDLLELFIEIAAGKLLARELQWKAGCAVSVVLASGGYPGKIETGKPIHGLEAAEATGASVFHAGTKSRNGEVVTAGGRVLNVTGVGATFRAAIATAYAGVEQIRFEGREYRRDIAARVA